jgi:hypothetical protein
MTERFGRRAQFCAPQRNISAFYHARSIKRNISAFYHARSIIRFMGDTL